MYGLSMELVLHFSTGFVLNLKLYITCAVFKKYHLKLMQESRTNLYIFETAVLVGKDKIPPEEQVQGVGSPGIMTAWQRRKCCRM